MDNVSKMTSTDLLERLLDDGVVELPLCAAGSPRPADAPAWKATLPGEGNKKGLRREIAELRAENRALLAGYNELAQWIKEFTQ